MVSHRRKPNSAVQHIRRSNFLALTSLTFFLCIGKILHFLDLQWLYSKLIVQYLPNGIVQYFQLTSHFSSTATRISTKSLLYFSNRSRTSGLEMTAIWSWLQCFHLLWLVTYIQPRQIRAFLPNIIESRFHCGWYQNLWSNYVILRARQEHTYKIFYKSDDPLAQQLEFFEYAYMEAPRRPIYPEILIIKSFTVQYAPA